MSSGGNYMDGVPVKISEKYRPPPAISVPSGVLERTTSSEGLIRGAVYDFTLETSVVRKLDEWKAAREAQRHERDMRLRVKAEERRREAERRVVEEERRRLDVADVSYPSADEIGDLSPEEAPTQAPQSPLEPPRTDSEECNRSDDILKPIQVPMDLGRPRINLLDDPDPIRQLNSHNKFVRPGNLRKSAVDKLNVSDFEHDTSSPFDNLELKSINEIELLAQVLNAQSISTSNADQQPTYVYPETGVSYPQTQNYPTYDMTNGYDYKYPQYDYYPAGYSYTVPYQTVPDYSANNSNTVDNSNYYKHSNYTDNNYAYQYQYTAYAAEPPSDPQSLIRTRSKSVPDIVKELNDEVAEAQKAKKRSHNCSPNMFDERKPEREIQPPLHREDLPNPFDELSPRLQLMCKSISAMGFPTDRVARACATVGKDDKKVIEYLLIMGQLMDLGFKESNVGRALVKNDFNRDKALDELIS